MTSLDNRRGGGSPANDLDSSGVAVPHPFRVKVNSTDAGRIVWAVPWRKGKSCIVDLHVMVHNTGSKTVRDVAIMLHLPASIYAPEIKRSPDEGSRLLQIDHAADAVSGEPWARVIYKIGAIHPGVTCAMRDFVILTRSSRVRTKTTATCRDGGRVSITSSFVVGYPIRVAVIAEDTPSISKEVTMETLDLKDSYIQSIYRPSHAAHISTGPVRLLPQRARIFVVRKLLSPAPEVPIEVGAKFSRARQKDADEYDAFFADGIGYISAAHLAPFNLTPA